MLLGGLVTAGLTLSNEVSPGRLAADDFQPVVLLETSAATPTGSLAGDLTGSAHQTAVHGTAASTTRATTTAVTTTTTPPAPTTTTNPPPSQTELVFEAVNTDRQAAGCAPLKDDSRLDTAAQAHSADMAQNGYFSHTTPAGVTFEDRETAVGYPSPGGENIAQGYTSAASVMTAWMNSPDHKANILNCQFTAIGVGLATNGWYWTQDFGY